MNAARAMHVLAEHQETSTQIYKPYSKHRRVIDMLRQQYEGDWHWIPWEHIWKDLNSNRRHAYMEAHSIDDNSWVSVVRIVPDNVTIWWRENHE